MARPRIVSSNTGKGSKSVDTMRVRSEEEMRETLDQLNDMLSRVTSTSQDHSTSDKLLVLTEITSLVIPMLAEEAMSNFPNSDRATVAGRLMSAVKDLSGILRQRHDIETANEFNARSPRAQVAFGWLIDLFREVAIRQLGTSTDAVDRMFADLANSLEGWEDRIERRMKGVSARALPALESPFVEEFRERMLIS